MKKSKSTNPEEENAVAVDRISDLPGGILEFILSRLPTTEQVIRTAILSTRWRYLWTSIPSFPSLDIDISRVRLVENFDEKQFEKFVSWALSSNNTHLDSFRLHCSHNYYKSTVDMWLEAAVVRKVKSLELIYIPYDEEDFIELPHCLLTCESLELFRLDLFDRPLGLPDYKILRLFPSLKVLELKRVDFWDDDEVEVFFKSFPLLEDLSLIDCLLNALEVLCISCPKLKTLRIDNRKMADDREEVNHDDDSVNRYEYANEGLCGGLYISCPQLVFFEYAGHIANNFCFENLDSLKKVVLYPEDMSQKDLSFIKMGATLCELFAGVSHVESLSLNRFFILVIDVGCDSEGDFPASLPNVKTLEISTRINPFTMNRVIRILRVSPNLESLNLIIEQETFLPESWELDEVLTRHLKRVEFLGFNGEKLVLDTACLLMEHGNVLEEVVFRWSEKVKYHKKSMEFMKQVSKFHKASSSVKLISLLKD